jgi:hypothetical protein
MAYLEKLELADRTQAHSNPRFQLYCRMVSNIRSLWRIQPIDAMTARDAIRSRTSAAGSVDTARCRRSRTRSSRRLSDGAAHRNPCTRRRTGRHRSAWFRWPGGRNADRSTCFAEPVGSSSGFYHGPGERRLHQRELAPAYIRSRFSRRESRTAQSVPYRS